MINLKLIKQCASSVHRSLEQHSKLHQSLLHIQEVLPESALLKLQKYVKSEKVPWEFLDERLSNQDCTRRKVTWDPDTIIEELHTAFDNVTDTINEIFPGNQQQNFIGISLWEDTAGYNMKWHTDNPMLSCAIQIYLFDTCPAHCGTTFIVNNKQVDLPFINNTGYAVNHNVNEKLIHKPSCTIPENTYRYSLYAGWSFSKKLLY